MKYKVVTCFDENILKHNGSRLLEQFKNNWQPSIEFHCYYYNMDIANYSLPKAKNIKYHNLSDVEEYATFVEENKDHNGTEGGAVSYTHLLDGLGTSAKVFSISECAFNNKECWLLWIDPLSMNLKDIRTSTLDRYFPKKDSNVDFASIPENDHILAFNISRQTSVDLLGDWRGAYMSGEYMNYREWGSSFVLSRLITIYNSHGMFIHELEDLENILINLKNKDMQGARDSSGDRIVQLSDTETSPDILPSRYKQLADMIRFYKPKTILETGTWNGGRAIEMALASFDTNDEVHYIGYDLFEDATTQTDKEEFNAKPHNTKLAVVKRLDEFKEHMKKERQKEFSYELYKGNVRDTLNGMYTDEVDFALIGSGNSEQTVQHEYNILKNVPVVVGDHYFTKDDDDKIPSEKYQGIKKVFDAVQTKKVDAQETTEDGWTNFDEEATTRKHVLPSSDKVAGGGHTHLVVFLHDATLEGLPEDLKRVPIVVHPRDCVPKDYIKNNIKTNMDLLDPKKWVSKHPPHKEKGIIVSAGPYLDYKALKKFIKENPESKVLTVKHAYPHLLKNKIKPWGCIVLDPRSITGKSTHNIVRKDLFKTLDPKTNFFIASMTDPSVTNFLLDNNASIWGWHAYTDSLRQEEEQGSVIHNHQVKLNEDLGIPKGATLITGGTCAAMRSIGLLHTMGFRDIHLFGFDCCRDEPTKEEMTETVGDIEGGETPKPKYIQVNVKDKSYWTTGELLAMAQDCEKIFADPSLDGILSFHGEDSMVADLWKIKEQQETRPVFRDYYDK
jgi:hypothetical protein